jgi:hypothetical protein
MSRKYHIVLSSLHSTDSDETNLTGVQLMKLPKWKVGPLRRCIISARLLLQQASWRYPLSLNVAGGCPAQPSMSCQGHRASFCTCSGWIYSFQTRQTRARAVGTTLHSHYPVARCNRNSSTFCHCSKTIVRRRVPAHFVNRGPAFVSLDCCKSARVKIRIC